MLEAAFWGLLGASALLVGAVAAFTIRAGDRPRGLVLAFGAGMLFGAVAYELIEEAVEHSVTGLDVGLGFALGALTFYLGSVAIDRRQGPAGGDTASRLSSHRNPRTQGNAIVLGAVLDGIPESVVLGLSILGGTGVGIPVLAAVFLSNVPEALSASSDLEKAGLSRTRIFEMWLIVVLASGLAAALGYAILGSAPASVVVGTQAFAAGAILTMLSESMIPEAYETGGRAVGLATSFGFAVATFLTFFL